VTAARFALPAALAGIAAGILAADLGLISQPIGWLVAGAAGVTAGVLGGGRAALVAVAGVGLIGLGGGAWRQQVTDPEAVPIERSVASLVDGSEHQLIGTVIDDPRPRADRLQLVLGDLLVEREGGAWRLADRLLLWLPRGIEARSGDRLRVTAEAQLAEDFDGFAYREHLARQGIGAIARVRGADVLPSAGGPGTVMAVVRASLLGGLNDLVPEPEAALGAGILLGVRASIAPEINEAFAAAGLTHVVAISGWNIAIVAALVLALVRPLGHRRGGRWTTAVLAAAAVGAYVVLTGASPSVVRAALMAGAMLVGRLGGSRAHATSALGLAALVMLLAAPAVLWDVGFQLSLLATAGLIWYGRGIERRLGRWPAWLREPVALTLAAQLATLPVILVNFERLSLVAPLANVLVVPIVPLAMLGSAGAALGGLAAGPLPGPMGDALSWLLGGSAWLVLRAMITVGQLCAAIPLASVELSVPPPVAVAWYPMLALAGWAARSDAGPAADHRPVADEAMTGAMAVIARAVRPAPAALGLIVVLGAITVATGPDGRLRVTTLDVGQGDAILVRGPTGRTMLVDGGPDPELTLRRLGAHLPFHVRRIDVLVLSHPHQDHVAGLVDVLDRFEIGVLLHAGIGFENAAYDRLLADAEAGGVPVRTARTGDRFALGDATVVEVIYPSETDASLPLPEGDINNGSVVLLLRSAGFRALLTGDAEAPVEAALVARGVLEPVDLLKVGHHGSASSTSPALLAATRPSVAVISSGEGNEYGHPTPQTLETLRGMPGLAVHRTDLDGDVEVSAGGSSYRVRTDAGWSPARPTHGGAVAGSIGPWPYPTERPSPDCWTTRSCPTAFASTPRASPASRSRPRGWWPSPASRSTAGWSRRRRCSTTSTSPRSGAAAASTASSARGGWRQRGTRSSPCRSPPIRSPPCSTTIASRSAGRRCWWPWPTGTWPRRS